MESLRDSREIPNIINTAYLSTLVQGSVPEYKEGTKANYEPFLYVLMVNMQYREMVSP